MNDDTSSDDDSTRFGRPFRFMFHAFGWGIAGSCVSAASALVGTWTIDLLIEPTGFHEPMKLWSVMELMGWCGWVGLLAGALIGGLFDGPNRVVGAAVWGCCGAITGAIGGGLTPAFIEAIHGSVTEELCTILAWGVAGVFAGVAGYCRNRLTIPDPRDDDEVVDVLAERPRLMWVRGTPAGRLVPVFGVAVGCLVVSLVAPSSTTGWAVVALGLLGLAVGCALVGQERRIAELERGMKKVTKGDV